MENNCSIICNTCGKIKRHLLPEERNCPHCGRVKALLVKPGENPPEGICNNNKWFPRTIPKTTIELRKLTHVMKDNKRYKDALQRF